MDEKLFDAQNDIIEMRFKYKKAIAKLTEKDSVLELKILEKTKVHVERNSENKIKDSLEPSTLLLNWNTLAISSNGNLKAPIAEKLTNLEQIVHQVQGNVEFENTINAKNRFR